jgi:hypothetical protein
VLDWDLLNSHKMTAAVGKRQGYRPKNPGFWDLRYVPDVLSTIRAARRLNLKSLCQERYPRLRV